MNKIRGLYTKYEFPIFIFITLLTSAQVFLYWVFPTLDGPHHIHNSNVIIGMLQGNELFHQYYSLHPIPVSNLVGHGLLSLFNLFLPSNQALNLLVFLYMAGMAFGFRYLLVSATGRFSPMGYAVFPFITNSSLILGLFNFCLGIVLFFFVLGYWFKVHKKLSLKPLLFLGLLLIVLLFTHILSFALFGIALVVFVVYDLIYTALVTNKVEIRETLLRILNLALITVPSLIIIYFYQQTIGDIAGSNLFRDVRDNVSLLQNFYYVRPLVIYRVVEDGIANIPLFIGMMLLVIIYITNVLFKRNKTDGNSFNRGYLLTMTLLFALFIFITPPGFLLHTILIRLTLIFFLFLAMWLASVRFPSWLELLSAVFFLTMFTWHQFRMGQLRTDFSLRARDMHKISEFMEPNTVFLPINGGSVWVNQYIMNYVGSEKQLMNVLNPQAYGPFPVVYDYYTMPYTTFGGHSQNDISFYFRSGPYGNAERPIDYVVVYRDNRLQKLRDDENYGSFFSILDEKFEFVADSPDGYGTLYRKKQE